MQLFAMLIRRQCFAVIPRNKVNHFDLIDRSIDLTGNGNHLGATFALRMRQTGRIMMFSYSYL